MTIIAIYQPKHDMLFFSRSFTEEDAFDRIKAFTAPGEEEIIFFVTIGEWDGEYDFNFRQKELV